MAIKIKEKRKKKKERKPKVIYLTSYVLIIFAEVLLGAGRELLREHCFTHWILSNFTTKVIT